jgi:hypothetical protein
MKMNRQNPGGEGKATMKKGNELGMDKGKGDLKPFTCKPGMGSLGASKAGHVRSTHAHATFTGSVTHGSSKACK